MTSVRVSSNASHYGQDVTIRQFRLTADEPIAVGGNDAGPSPFEWILAGLGACKAITLKMYAEHKGWKLENIGVDLSYEPHVKPPVIQVELTLTGNLDAEQRQRLCQISDRCPVHQLMILRVVPMSDAIQTTITPHVQDLGGFQARRLLPSDERTMVGPFIFFDHLGPAIFPAGKGVDVRPHPHINLATVTYLFEGALLHRDSLGTIQEICPGEVNWMTAGKGISHSERSPDSERIADSTLHGIQTWVALPEEAEETAPCFHHHAATDIPTWEENGVVVKLIAGEAYGYVSPVKALSPILYLDLQFPAGGHFTLTTGYSERAVYSITAGLAIDGLPIEQHRLVILEPDHAVEITSSTADRCMVIGGEPLGVRHKWWNFVSSRLDRIEQAKRDWQAGQFGQVPDETEFIPLPDNAG